MCSPGEAHESGAAPCDANEPAGAPSMNPQWSPSASRGETDSIEAGLVGGGYQSGGNETARDASEAAAADERDARARDDDALLGGIDDVAETFQQGFQDFLAALQERPLREHIGHTPVQVLAGGVLGVVVGTAYALALRDEAGAPRK